MPRLNTSTPTKVSVGSSDTVVLTANGGRAYAVFVNDSDETIFLALGTLAVINEGIRLNANGGNYEIKKENLWVGEVSAICASGSKNLTVTEST